METNTVAFTRNHILTHLTQSLSEEKKEKMLLSVPTDRETETQTDSIHLVENSVTRTGLLMPIPEVFIED